MPDEKKKAYCITLQGGGDTYRFLVDEEIWNWIDKRDDEDNARLRKNSGFQDPTTPQQLQEKRKEQGEEPLAYVTIGSFDNDKALACVCMDITGSHGFNSTRDIAGWLNNNPEYELQPEEYEGYIY